MRTSICLFLTDLVDEGADVVLGRVRDRAGLDAISIACNYHHARDVLPHNPRTAVRYMDAEVYVRVRPERYGLIQPPVSPLLADSDVFGAVVEQAAASGLSARGWANVTHNSRLGTAYPQCTVRNLFGDSYRSNLCPANPDVRAYAAALFADITAYPLSAVFAESVGFLPFDHGDHHERSHVRLSPAARFVLGLCFCPHCERLAYAEGVDPAGLRSRLVSQLDRVFRGEPAALDDRDVTPADLAELLGDEFDGILAARRAAVSGLVERIVAACSDHDVPFTFMDLSGGLKAPGSGVQMESTSEPAARLAWRDGVDFAAIGSAAAGLSGLAYVREVEQFGVEVAAYRALVPAGKTLSVACRPMPPDCPDVENLRRKVGILREHEVDWVDFYHYAFMPLAHLDWVREALAPAGALPRDEVR